MYNQKIRKKRECNIKPFKADKNMKILSTSKNSSAQAIQTSKTSKIKKNMHM